MKHKSLNETYHTTKGEVTRSGSYRDAESKLQFSYSAGRFGFTCRFLLLTAAMIMVTFCAVPDSLFSQVSEGDRVRVSASDDGGIYLFQSIENNTLSLLDESTGETITMSADQVRRFRVSEGYRSRGRGLLRGAGFGFLAGAGTGAVLGLVSGHDDPHIWLGMRAEEKAIFYGIALGLVGVVPGGIIGMIRPGERWRRVSLDVFPAGENAVSGAVIHGSIRF